MPTQGGESCTGWRAEVKACMPGVRARDICVVPTFGSFHVFVYNGHLRHAADGHHHCRQQRHSAQNMCCNLFVIVKSAHDGQGCSRLAKPSPSAIETHLSVCPSGCMHDYSILANAGHDHSAVPVPFACIFTSAGMFPLTTKCVKPAPRFRPCKQDCCANIWDSAAAAGQAIRHRDCRGQRSSAFPALRRQLHGVHALGQAQLRTQHTVNCIANIHSVSHPQPKCALRLRHRRLTRQLAQPPDPLSTRAIQQGALHGNSAQAGWQMYRRPCRAFD